MTFNNCTLCKHLNLSNTGKFICKAYPKGIPKEMLAISSEKRMNQECANGVKFEKATTEFVEKRQKKMFDNPPAYIKEFLK